MYYSIVESRSLIVVISRSSESYEREIINTCMSTNSLTDVKLIKDRNVDIDKNDCGISVLMHLPWSSF
jgi:hypothetical protein